MKVPKSPSAILESAYQQAIKHINKSFLTVPQQADRVTLICGHLNNRAPARLLLACSLAKVHMPQIDIRRPYSEIKGKSYSGRNYDEKFVEPFRIEYQLPCNKTTAFLTPAFRTKNVPLMPDTNLGGHAWEAELYRSSLLLLDDVENGRLSAENLLLETIRCLALLREAGANRLLSLKEELRQGHGDLTLSSEEIVTLVQQHMSSPRSARLPVLAVAAAYEAAASKLGEQLLPLMEHNAADEQTGAIGDLQITIMGENDVVTSYEMKTRKVTIADIDGALSKIRNSGIRVDNYIFITTDSIDVNTNEYAASLYRETGGIEFVVLDCIQFLRHFLHLFHRLRLEFLDVYQELVLSEPDSAVSQPLKEAFLALRLAAESSFTDEV